MPEGEPSKTDAFVLRAFGGSIAAKLYCFAFLSLLAVASLSIASIYFSRTTESAAQHLYGDSFLGILNSTRLELLLANHRRIVESMPPEVDRDRLQAERNELDQIKLRLIEPDRRDHIEKHEPIRSALESRIAESLPSLFEAAEPGRVLRQRVRAGQGGGAGRRLRPYRQRHRAADQGAIATCASRRRRRPIAFVSATAKSLAVWVLLSALRGDRADRPDRACHHAPGAVAARRHHPGDGPARPPRHHHRDPVARRPRRGRRHGARGGGVQGQRHPAHRPRGRAQAAQPPHRHRPEQHDARAVHVRRRAEADRLQQDLCADVRAPPELSQPGTLLQAIENYRATIGNGAIANPEQMAAATAIQTRARPPPSPRS